MARIQKDRQTDESTRESGKQGVQKKNVSSERSVTSRYILKHSITVKVIF
jgi:hypothetical protein